MGGFSEPMGGQVEGDGKVFVLLDSGLKPLLGVLEEVLVSEERDREGDVGSWWCQVAVFERLMNNVESRLAAMRRIA